MKPALNLLLCLLLFTGCRHIEEERFLADARINGKPVRFTYDTGAEMSVILTRPARRLGLQLSKPPPGQAPSGKVRVGQTGFCRFSVGSETGTLKLATYRSPWWVPWDVDGLIGWPEMRDDFIAIVANQAAIKSSGPLADTNGWSCLPLYRRTGVLALEIPRPDGKTGVVEIDTGNSGGVSLSPARWAEWRAVHRHAHWKMHAAFMPGSGLGIGRTYQGNNLQLGPLSWTNILVTRANRTEMGIANSHDVFEASIGIAALKQLDVLIAQKAHVAYVRPRAAPASACPPALGNTPPFATNSWPSTVRLNLQAHEYMDRALDALENRKFNEAVTNATRFLQLQPDNAGAFALRAEALFNLHAGEAKPDTLAAPLSDFTRALELEPDMDEAYFERANIQYLRQRWDDAATDYRHFCDANHDDANYARFYLWLSRARKGDRSTADQELAAYFFAAEPPKAAPWERSIAAFLLGRLSEADFLRTAARAARKNDSGSQCEAFYYTAMKRQLAGDAAVARQYFQKCLATGKKEYYEYNFASAELSRADGHPA